MAEITIQLKQRTDTAANWTAADPVLARGELGFESDTGRFKLGNGLAPWTLLGYIDQAQFNCPTFSECYSILQDDDTNLDQNLWKMIAVTEGLSMRLVSDDLVDETTFLQVERSGTGASMVVDTITWPGATHMRFGDNALQFPKITRVGTQGGLTIAGGDDFDDGGYVALFGSTHPTSGGDVTWGSNNVPVLQWDESAGAHIMSVGSGATKETPFTFDLQSSGQNATFTIDATTGFMRRPEIVLNFDADDEGGIIWQEEGVQLGFIRGEASFGGFTDVLVISESRLSTGPTNGVLVLQADNTTRIICNEVGTDFRGNWRMAEAADAVHADTTGFGQVWIDSADAHLKYRDETGADLDLSNGVQILGTPADNQIAIWTADDTIEGVAGLTYDGTDLVAGNYDIDVNQTVGAGQDNYVLTYDDGDGQISLEALPAATRQFTAVTETTTSRNAVAFEAVFVDDDTAGGAVTINLPAGATDDQIIVKKLGTTGNVTLDGNASENIDGSLTFALTAQYSSVTVMWNGSEWSIV